MANPAIKTEVLQLRDQGLTDNLIVEELKKKGRNPMEVEEAIRETDADFPAMPGMQEPIESQLMAPSPYAGPPAGPPSAEGNIYDRIEEITENMIDKKWDELIAEVRKIIDWKEKIEETQRKLAGNVEKLKEDFRELHGGVLGKLETYDERMQEVSTELGAVGKVFKEVIPEFVENVKELKGISSKKRE